MSFKKNHYQLVRGALSKDTLKYVQINCDIHEKCNLFYRQPTEENPYPFGDAQSPNSFAWYSSIHSDALLVFLRDKISDITKKNLVETYSYARSYYKGAILEKHWDRPSCEYSATVCVEKGNTNWPIFFETTEGKTIEIELEDGDMIVYQGTILNHWRNPYEGTRHRQIFVHYVDLDGPYGKTNKYDGRPELALGPQTKSPDAQ